MPPPTDGGPLWVALEGPSGVGKSSVVRALAERTGRTPVAEAFAATVARPSLEFSDRGDLLRIERRLVKLELARFRTASRLRQRGHPVLLDTGFLGPLTYSMGIREVLGTEWDVADDVREEFGRAAASGAWGIPDLTLYLDAPVGVVRQRARSAPATHPPRLVDRHLRVGRWEREYWLERIARAAPGRVLRIGAQGGVAATAGRVLGQLRATVPPPPPTAGESLAVLAALGGPPAPLPAPARSATLKKGTLSPRPPRR